MPFLDVFEFPGHILLGHFLSALPIYIFGQFHMLLGAQVIEPAYGFRKQKRKKKVAILMMLCGLIYVTYHVIELIGLLSSSPNHHRSPASSIPYGIMGICILLAGSMKYLFLCGKLSGLSLDFSVVAACFTIAFGVFFHVGNTSFNSIHYLFAIFLILASLLDLLEQAVQKKLQFLVGTLFILSAAFLVSASDEIVSLLTKKGFPLGFGTAVILCFLFAMVHIFMISWMTRRGRLIKWTFKKWGKSTNILGNDDDDEIDQDREIPLTKLGTTSYVKKRGMRNNAPPWRKPVFSISNNNNSSGDEGGQEGMGLSNENDPKGVLDDDD